MQFERPRKRQHFVSVIFFYLRVLKIMFDFVWASAQ